MQTKSSGKAALDAAFSASEQTYRDLVRRSLEDKHSYGPLDDRCGRLLRESGHLGRVFDAKIASWKESDYISEGRTPCEKAACAYEVSLSNLLFSLTYEDASEELQKRIVAVIRLKLQLSSDLKTLVTGPSS